MTVLELFNQPKSLKKLYTPFQKNPPPNKSYLIYFAVSTVNFKAMIDNIVAIDHHSIDQIC